MIAHVVKLDHEADGMVRGDKKMMLMAREWQVRDIDRWRVETWVKGKVEQYYTYILEYIEDTPFC